MQNYSDAQLSLLLNNDCDLAYAEIYKRYWFQMYMMVFNRTKDDIAAEEIVQNIFLKLWARRNVISIADSFKPYFSKAIKFQVINYFDKIKHRQNYFDWLANNQQHVHDNAEEQIDVKSLEDLIDQSICTLPERCQLVFRLRVNEGLSQREIATHLDISEKTVEGQLTKARKHLKKALVTAGALESILLFLDL